MGLNMPRRRLQAVGLRSQTLPNKRQVLLLLLFLLFGGAVPAPFIRPMMGMAAQLAGVPFAGIHPATLQGRI